MSVALAIQRHWQHRTPVSLALYPLSLVYRVGVALRRALYRSGWLAIYRSPVPVIVVGNITVGGVGKTPLVSWMAAWLGDHGWQPGIVHRGYGGNARDWPRAVTAASAVAEVGDEAVLLAHGSGWPVVAGPDRAAAVRLLLAQYGCNIVISDDGLQHLALARDLEVAVSDTRGAGNGFCLPAGPLREPVARLGQVDARVINGATAAGAFSMRSQLGSAINLLSGASRPLATLVGQPVAALAGIGYPQRFFEQLTAAGLTISGNPFPDHHRFQARDLTAIHGDVVLMTEKDAVKCRPFADARFWYVPMHVEVDAAFGDWLQARLGTPVSAVPAGRVTQL